VSLRTPRRENISGLMATMLFLRKLTSSCSSSLKRL
jgi:hypothetical protein